MIPHNSRKFRAILDLSFVLRLFGIEVTSVNDATNKEKSPTNAMGQLGQVLPRLIAKMAEATLEEGPLMFAKLDIKDGYWRMVVAEGKEWNFAYVLPKRDTDTDFHIVVPSALQMGWAESPPFFCAASETARDVADVLASAPLGTAIPLLIPGLSPIRVPSPNIRVTSRNILRPLTAAHPNTCLAHNII